MNALRTALLLMLAGSALTPAYAITHEQVLTTYANIAHAVYEDSAKSARTLQTKIDRFLAAPDEAGLADVRQAWIAARVPYQQSEVFRFGNAIVDDWEAQLNAWPLDEGLIDYVADSYQPQLGNPGGQLNIIATQSVQLGNTKLDLSTLEPQLLASLNELGGSEVNVATGYHAIEFLLWGQDLNSTAAGAGERPYTDFLPGEGCTHGHCERRAEYLRTVTDLLVSDLEYMVGQWAPDQDDNYRQELLALEGNAGLTRMIFGMGSLALGELAGERMKVALEANSPEDEHDCFSDNTHWSHFHNALGIRNVYIGEYRRIDGKRVTGPSLAALAAEADPAIDRQARQAMESTEQALQAMVDKAEAGMKFDQMIAPANAEGRRIINAAIDALVVETDALTRVARAIGIDNLTPDNADHTF
ncbi:imelysin family protein [Woeseia oceani]|uniref:Peptidase n=1 Tax=Woeseia oceani TaxID=1548547 RepID=A0A193LJ82_9GAMM|nr:imelysin family protein [Woeseia oceani]ANO52567.1 peptidase [Woeseia oceani]